MHSLAPFSIRHAFGCPDVAAPCSRRLVRLLGRGSSFRSICLLTLMNYLSNLATLAKRIESAGAGPRVVLSTRFHLTLRAVDSVVGIDENATSGSFPTSADASTPATSESRAANVAAVAAPTTTPKRTSGLGAVKKSKAAASTSLSEKRSPQQSPDHRVSTSSGGVFLHSPRNDSSNLPATSAVAPVIDADPGNESAAAPTEQEPAVSLPVATTDVVAEIHDPETAHPVSTHVAPAPAVLDSPAVAVEVQSTVAGERGDADADADAPMTVSQAHNISDRLSKRESQLEVRACAFIRCIRQSLSVASERTCDLRLTVFLVLATFDSLFLLKALAVQLGASEQMRVRTSFTSSCPAASSPPPFCSSAFRRRSRPVFWSWKPWCQLLQTRTKCVNLFLTRIGRLSKPPDDLQTLREIASSAQAAAAAACLQAKQEAEERHQLTQQLELKAGQIASLMAEGRPRSC
jgi:hypothetical protein